MLSCESCLHKAVCKYRESMEALLLEALLLEALALAEKEEMKSGRLTNLMKCKHEIRLNNETGTR